MSNSDALKQYIRQHGPIKVASTEHAQTSASVNGLHVAATGFCAQFGVVKLSKTGRLVRRLTTQGPFRTTAAEVANDIAQAAAVKSSFALRVGPVFEPEAERILWALTRSHKSEKRV